MKQSFKDNCEKFINMLLTRRPKRDLRKFDENKWYESAYSTVARPLGVMKRNQGGYDSWHSKNYNKLKEMILDLLRRLTPNGTVDMNDEIEHIANECNVPFGVVQKIVDKRRGKKGNGASEKHEPSSAENRIKGGIVARLRWDSACNEEDKAGKKIYCGGVNGNYR